MKEIIKDFVINKMENEDLFIVIGIKNNPKYIAISEVKFHIKLDELLITYKNNKEKKIFLIMGLLPEILEKFKKQETIFIIESSENKDDNFNYPAKNGSFD